MSAEHIEADFPTLREAGYRITSEATTDYNCFAWAANDTSAWWSPLPISGYYWPEHLPRSLNINSFVALYAHKGFVACEDGEPEPGIEKIALYADSNGNVTHAARSASEGAWSSKLGVMEDIEHGTLMALEGSDYGGVVCFLKRPLVRAPAPIRQQ